MQGDYPQIGFLIDNIFAMIVLVAIYDLCFVLISRQDNDRLWLQSRPPTRIVWDASSCVCPFDSNHQTISLQKPPKKNKQIIPSDLFILRQRKLWSTLESSPHREKLKMDFQSENFHRICGVERTQARTALELRKAASRSEMSLPIALRRWLGGNAVAYAQHSRNVIKTLEMIISMKASFILMGFTFHNLVVPSVTWIESSAQKLKMNLLQSSFGPKSGHRK